jgi:hypothetical protein
VNSTAFGGWSWNDHRGIIFLVVLHLVVRPETTAELFFLWTALHLVVRPEMTTEAFLLRAVPHLMEETWATAEAFLLWTVLHLADETGVTPEAFFFEQHCIRWTKWGWQQRIRWTKRGWQQRLWVPQHFMDKTKTAPEAFFLLTLEPCFPPTDFAPVSAFFQLTHFFFIEPPLSVEAEAKMNWLRKSVPSSYH